ncbi:hypothetical protein SAMN05216311_114214 [Chitinophaga sp. CF418]|nr:hypothetical protein SAMN05216311_114214 [Chitinophaga sp. CF418]
MHNSRIQHLYLRFKLTVANISDGPGRPDSVSVCYLLFNGGRANFK